jgi:Flp pilus assembly protein TadD
MGHTKSIFITMLLACLPLLAQGNPAATLHDAFVEEQEGKFDTAINTIRLSIDSDELAGVALGRAYIMLGVGYHHEGKFSDANIAFEQSLRLLEHDLDHVSDYATALNNYGGLNGDAGQFDVARAMWLKALHLSRQMGDHAGAMRTLTNLVQLDVAQKRTREARRYIRQASEEMKWANDLTNDDATVFFETQGWLALAEGHAAEAVGKFQQALELSQRVRGSKNWVTGWEWVLRGKAYAQSGDLSRAAADMRKGLAILDCALGRRNLNYFAAETAYSEVLDRIGSHTEAGQLRLAAEQARKDFYGSQCAGCTINVAGFQ